MFQLTQKSFLFLTLSLFTISGSFALSGFSLPVAQAADQVNQENFEALAKRWEDSLTSSKTADFLKERADQMPIENGAWPEISYLELLKADERGFQGSYAQLIEETGAYYGLTRQIKTKYVLDLFQTGIMKPRAGKFGNTGESYSHPGVYFELNLKDYNKTFAWADAELHFDYKILDEREDYFINPSWSYGTYDIYTAAPSLNPGRIVYYINYYLRSKTEWQGDMVYRDNEVVFVNDVAIKHLQKIIVPTEERDSLIKELRAKKAPLPKHWKDWESHIIGKEKPKKRKN